MEVSTEKNCDPTKGGHQLYVSPQNENLGELYRLINTLVDTLQENKDVKNRIVSRIDNLDRVMRRGSEETNGMELEHSTNDEDNMIFHNFISSRTTTSKDGDKYSDTNAFLKLKEHNGKLKLLLKEKQNENKQLLAQDLPESESLLAYITRCLRDHVAASNSEKLEAIKVAVGKMHSSLDSEMHQYKQNVDGIDELMEISKCYRYLLQNSNKL
ncbi:hypothetical protein TPHA_0H00590 [Tetrapisispora phaffii CBS 4417]|uniref:Uncharacterized protein n=1 Tax=Tetrapisispora phaffii (strain ATCC 24235 / CBS 4417 / NBRC 1672 / NRRL Y-8282 / UCD 70-5) TaxID=1071381 RepID=G8BWW5_TETPH|nr:hypothetical protein TPHA_0H00590 [Tetrapisispora phaffii CBS 4417]CCE64269.1 hypothetical protein TPHA_0H00590 [Tetrapisispora phaffii CBS 4417]